MDALCKVTLRSPHSRARRWQLEHAPSEIEIEGGRRTKCSASVLEGFRIVADPEGHAVARGMPIAVSPRMTSKIHSPSLPGAQTGQTPSKTAPPPKHVRE